MQAQQQTSRDLSARETGGLIGSDKVEGTAVYRPNGDRIGTIERVMIDKRTGKVGYAVMSFGGFLGMGSDHYPIPWPLLVYNENLGGYEVGVSDEQLRGAPNSLPAIPGWWRTAEMRRRSIPITAHFPTGEKEASMSDIRNSRILIIATDGFEQPSWKFPRHTSRSRRQGRCGFAGR